MKVLLIGLLVFGAVACGRGEEQATTPQACIRALDTAEQVFGISGQFSQLTVRITEAAADGVLAAGTFDIAGIEAATADVEQINVEMNALNAELEPLTTQYNQAADACRGGE